LKNNWFLDIVRKNRKDTDKLEKYTSQIKKLTKITEKEKIKAVKVADNVIKVYQGNIPDELKETDKFFKYYVAVKDNVP
ncbi:MAG: hypothetical protein LBE12_02185, partial [Planctomycetaceae bacterium]|nr:hypothetical protein [Planctomycetaceae bacterium]